MSAKDQYIDLCEARVQALEKELQLLTDWVCRNNEVLRDISPETTMDMFNAYKQSRLIEDETEI